MYLKKTHEICGLNHFWPVNYPLVNSSHRLYKLMCVPKRPLKSSCKFSIECSDENAVCFRPILLPNGTCTKLTNEKLNEILVKINDSLIKVGKKIKVTYRYVKDWLKNPRQPFTSTD